MYNGPSRWITNKIKMENHTISHYEIVDKKIIDFKDMVRKGVVELRPINAKKFETLRIRCFKDGKTGIWYGIPLEINKMTGEIKWRSFLISGQISFNLEDEESAKIWHVVKHHQSILGSPFQKGIPMMKVYDQTVEADTKMKKIIEGQNAVAIALGLFGSELADFARILGYTPENNDPNVLKSMVAERAQSRPDEFMRLWLNINRTIEQIFKRGLASNLIKFKPDTGFVYMDYQSLGNTEAGAIIKLSEPGMRSVLNAIDTESKHILKNKLGDYPEVEKKALTSEEYWPKPKLEDTLQQADLSIDLKNQGEKKQPAAKKKAVAKKKAATKKAVPAKKVKFSADVPE
jgi:hypothetical protein